MTGAAAVHPDRPRRRPKMLLGLFVVAVAAHVAVAYLLVPLWWRQHKKRHQALADAPRITHTASGIPGDALNVALVGMEKDLHLAMHAAGWYPADGSIHDNGR